MIGTKVTVPFLQEACGTVVDRLNGGWLVEMDDPSVVPEYFAYYPLVWVHSYNIENNLVTEDNVDQKEYIGEW